MKNLDIIDETQQDWSKFNLKEYFKTDWKFTIVSAYLKWLELDNFSIDTLVETSKLNRKIISKPDLNTNNLVLMKLIKSASEKGCLYLKVHNKFNFMLNKFDISNDIIDYFTNKGFRFNKLDDNKGYLIDWFKDDIDTKLLITLDKISPLPYY